MYAAFSQTSPILANDQMRLVLLDGHFVKSASINEDADAEEQRDDEDDDEEDPPHSRRQTRLVLAARSHARTRSWRGTGSLEEGEGR